MGSAMADSGIRVEKLNGNNYATWKFRVRMLLIRDDVWDIVDGTELSPEESPVEIAKWKKRDNKALATICLSVEDSQLVHVKDARSSFEAWSSLKNHHEKSSLANRLFLRKRMYSTRLERGGNMEEHISSVVMLADQLRNSGDKISDAEVVTVLLCSLPDDYDSLITALESRSESDLTLEFVKSRLNHESIKQKESEKKAESAFKAKINFGAKKNRQQQPVSSTENVEKRSCFQCGNPGHLKRNCPRKSGPARTQQAKRAEVKPAEYCFSASVRTRCEEDYWLVDSGATSHMTSCKELFDSISQIKKTICLADDRLVCTAGIGDISVITEDGFNLVLKDVLYVPDLGASLLSVNKIVKNGFQVSFSDKFCYVCKDNEVIIKASNDNGLFKISFETISAKKASVTEDSSILWHRRLGHINASYLKKMNLPVSINDEELSKCEACALGKLSRPPFPSSTNRQSTSILELVHSDVCGPMSESFGGKRYFVTFIDDFSRLTVAYPIRCKSEVFEKFVNFHRFMSESSGHKLRVIRSDNGGEYVSKKFQQYCNDNGIEQQFTTPYSPQQNGLAERANRFLVEMARTLLIDAGMDKRFWAESLVTAVYIKNRTPAKKIDYLTPYEIWYGKKADISNFRVFGSYVYAHIPKEKRVKFDSKAKKYRFVGYQDGIKGYRLVDPATNQIIVSRDVRFDEVSSSSTTCRVEKSRSSNSIVVSSIGNEDSEESQEESDSEVRSSNETLVTSSVSADSSQIETASSQESSVRRSERTTKGVPPLRYEEAVYFAGCTSAIKVPSTYLEATSGKFANEWKQAADDEINSLVKNETWSLVKLPVGKVAIPTKWVFQIKTNENGEVSRLKARIVAKGFFQQFGRDYEDTFAPVARFSSIRTILSIAATEGMVIEQLDVASAFLQGNLEEEVYVTQPDGYVVSGKEDLVYRLHKSLYGLKQAPRQWNRTMHEFLVEISFERCEEDWCLYARRNGQSKSFILLYVDDLIMASTNQDEMAEIKASMSKRFEVKLLGELKFFLGIRIERDESKRIIKLSQKAYIEETLLRFGMESCKPARTPQETARCDKGKADSSSLSTNFPYREAVGSLMYIMVVSRPDLASSVGILSRRLDNPQDEDIRLVKRVFRYLKGTVDLKLYLGGKYDDQVLKAYVDADWAGDSSDRKSTSGYLTKINHSTVIWCSKKQATVAISTAEAEYVAAAIAIQDVIWLRSLLSTLGYGQVGPTEVLEDNQACIAMAKCPKNHGRVKHIDIKYHFIRDRIERNEIQINYCEGERMVADILTKPLPHPRFVQLRAQLGLLD